MFLARTARQQDEINYGNTVNILETKYYNVEQEQDYGVDEEINFLQEDDEEATKSPKLTNFL